MAFFIKTETSKSINKKISSNGQTITIRDLQVNLSCHQLTVTTEEDGLTATDVMSLLNVELDSIGFPCYEMTSPASNPPSILYSRWLLGFSGVGTGILLLILPLIMGPLSLVVMTFIGIPSVALTLVLGAESYKKAAKLLFNGGILHMDTLFAVSTLTALAASIAALFIPGMPMMFEAGLLIFGFRHIGEAIRESMERSMELKARFQDRAPKRVKKVHEERIEDVSIDTINIDDLVLIQAGDLIPVDGVCESGEGLIDRSIEYGSMDPVSLKMKDKMSAGTILVEGAIHMRVTAPANQSLLARKDRSIAKSMGAKDESSWKTEADKVLHYFIPIVFGLAILSGLVVWHFLPLAIAIQSVVAVLVSACPCTLGLVTGMAVRVGMKKAADNKIDFKSTRKLEEADQIRHVVFDLNGTLTTIKPEVTEFSHARDENFTYEDCLKHILMLEQDSAKAIGMAIHAYVAAKLSSATHNLHPAIIDKSNHSGVKAVINNVSYVLGNQQMLMDNGISLDSYQHRQLESDETIMFFAREQTVAGHFILKRPLRPEAKAVVNALKKMDKQVHIFTGSDANTAMRYATVLNIPAENVHSLMTSADKVNQIEILQAKKQKRVAMIGDEENDADAIAASDFGVAMPTDGRSNMNRHVADAESKINSLEPVVSAFEISRQTGMNIRQNLIFSWSYNIAALFMPVGLLLFAGILLSPGVCVALMILQTSLILLNTYRFKQQDLVCLKQAREEGGLGEDSSYGAINALMPAPNVEASPSLLSFGASLSSCTFSSLSSLEQIQDIETDFESSVSIGGASSSLSEEDAFTIS